MVSLIGLILGIVVTSIASHAGDVTHQAAAGDHAVKAEAEQEHGGGHGTAEHGGAAAEPNILEFKPELSLATLIVFLVLLAVLWKFAWGPLSRALDARERQQEEAVARVEAAKAESERLLAEHRAQMNRASEEVASLLVQARRDAEASATSILQQAAQEAEATRLRAQREIGQAKDQALAEIWSNTADLAVSVAGKVLGKRLGEEEHRRLVQAAIEELPAAPTTNGHGGQTA
jgi:F-type H+-transporting ATPase subunit b